MTKAVAKTAVHYILHANALGQLRIGRLSRRQATMTTLQRLKKGIFRILLKISMRKLLH